MSDAAAEELIGIKVRNLRKARGVTLDELAGRTGLTKGYLSKIENAKKVPPIETLSRISSALEAEIAYFFQKEDDGEQPDRKVSFVRAHERKPAIRGGAAFGYSYESVAHKMRHKKMEPFIFTFPESVDEGTHFSHAGEEMVFILSGMVEFEIEGESKILSVGDCLYFDASLKHRGRAINGEARALVVVHQPGDGDR